MTRTIYFADKSLRFTDDAAAAADCRLAPDAGISRTKILKIFDTCNDIAVVCADAAAAERAFAAFAAEFTAVTAAGGAVVDAAGRCLMIYRNGRWDLPKGHWEPGETIERCAEREVAEETGVGAEIVRPLCETLHAYYFPQTARWELKRTCWFAMRPLADAALVPQTEEGITRAEWVGAAALPGCLSATFPTIRRVFRALESSRGER